MNEGSSAPSRNTIRHWEDGPSCIRRMEAFLHGAPYSPHRHDSYAIGVTRSGVQCFSYRGRRYQARPGQVHVLFPDELHDGAAGTEQGFCYRIAYIDPAFLQQALSGRALPFVRNPILTPNPAWRGLLERLWAPDLMEDEMMLTDIAVEAVDCLETAAGSSLPERVASPGIDKLRAVRDAITADPAHRFSLAELERIADMDRWSLARRFRSTFGTSPSRFRTMRQLERARARLEAGAPMADAALDAGFADQSHMNRQFRSAFGMTPRKWKLANTAD